jgi:excinuclease ABC subunit A
MRHCRKHGIDTVRSFERLPQKDQDFVIHGAPGINTQEAWESGKWYGVDGYFHWLESKSYKMHIRVLLSRYRSYQPCPKCHGGRFQPETLNYRIDPPGLTIADVAAVPLKRLAPILESFDIPASDTGARLVHQQVVSAHQLPCNIGLGYLTLDRPTRSLSGGEIQRVNLTTCLGASLVNTLRRPR